MASRELHLYFYSGASVIKNTGVDSSFPLLEEGLLKLDIISVYGKSGNTQAEHFPDRIFSLLSGYIEEIELFNDAYGLVKVKDRRELIVKHILDSISPLGYIKRLLENRLPALRGVPEDRKIRIADVGSGAGLPGIPLAICMPQADFTLIERMGRRAGFLRDAIAVLGLPNVRVEECEMEKYNVKREGSFNLVVFRAFRPLEPSILKGLYRLTAAAPNGVPEDGIIIAYKGRRESVEEEMAQVIEAARKGKGPPVGIWEVLPLDVPFLEEERHLLVINKPKETL